MRPEADGVFDVREADFEERVVRASKERAVVVDFWAPWCAPCRALGPILEKVVASYGGRAVLARVNVDDERALAAQSGVRGVPTVKIFRDGRVAGEFTGALGEAEVRRVLDRFVPSKEDEAAEEAARLFRAGDVTKAEALYREALEGSPGHPAATMGLAYIAFEKGELDAARELASGVEPGTKEHELAQGLLARLDFIAECRGQGGTAEVEKRLAASPDDLEARYSLAVCLASEGGYERALEEFMKIIERDRSFRDGAAKDAMVRIFSVVGRSSDLADDYRRRLARALY